MFTNLNSIKSRSSTLVPRVMLLHNMRMSYNIPTVYYAKAESSSHSPHWFHNQTNEDACSDFHENWWLLSLSSKHILGKVITTGKLTGKQALSTLYISYMSLFLLLGLDLLVHGLGITFANGLMIQNDTGRRTRSIFLQIKVLARGNE